MEQTNYQVMKEFKAMVKLIINPHMVNQLVVTIRFKITNRMILDINSALSIRVIDQRTAELEMKHTKKLRGMKM